MSDKTLKTAFLPRDDNFHEMLGYIGSRKTFDEFNTPQFTVGDTNLSSRVVNHWGKSGILPTSAKKGRGWNKFTLTEMAWIKLAGKLRNFGFSLSKIAEIKKTVLPSTNKEPRNYPFLECYLVQAWSRSEGVYFVALEDGRFDIGSHLEIQNEKEKSFPNKDDMLLLSLKGLLIELGIKIKPLGIMLPANYENLLFSRAVASSRVNSAEVNMKFKKGILKEIESTEIISENPDFNKISREFKEKGEFGEVTTKYDDGNRRSVHIKKRKRL